MISLRDYANSQEYVVLFWVSQGQSSGAETPLNYPDIDTADDWLDLRGYIDINGVWQWDGNGKPKDCRRNSVYRLSASSDENRWNELVSEYERGD